MPNLHLAPRNNDYEVHACPQPAACWDPTPDHPGTRPAGMLYHLSRNAWQFVPHFILDAAAPERSTATQARADALLYVRTLPLPAVSLTPSAPARP